MPSVIIVDDNPQIVNIIWELLKLAGHADIVIFTSPIAAMEHVMARGAPAMIITDYLMPGLNGSQLLGRIKEKHPGVKGVIMTCVPDEASLDQGAEGFPVIDKNRFDFFDEIGSLVRDFPT